MEKYPKIQKKSRAYAIIINNQNFSQDDRKGAEKDVEKLLQLQDLNISFEHILTNLTAQETIGALKFLATRKTDSISSEENGKGALKLLEFSKEEIEEFDDIGQIKGALKGALISKKLQNFADYSCLMVFISTHGSRDDELICPDGSTTTVAELSEIFNSENCKDLEGIPKMFFVQACRGKGRMIRMMADQFGNDKEKKDVKTKCKFLIYPNALVLHCANNLNKTVYHQHICSEFYCAHKKLHKGHSR